MSGISTGKLAITILAALALGALGGYYASNRLSAPVERDLMAEIRAAQPVAADAQAATAGLEPVEVMLVGLQQRLQQQPEDVDGWVLLSKSYFHLNRPQRAQQAYARAMALGYTGPWQPLPRIDSFSGINQGEEKFSSNLNIRNYSALETSEQAQKKPLPAGVAETSPTVSGLKLRVALSADLQQQLSPEHPVFVFARAAGNSGPPLAVVRRSVAELPFEIVLNDSHAMIPTQTLSSVADVIVGARISASGDAARQAGDYEKISAVIPSNVEKTVELLIGDRIQQ